MVFAPSACLHCHYELHGLPASHICPECGRSYDVHTRVWRRRPRHRDTVRDALGPALGFLVFAPAAVAMSRIAGLRHPFVLFLLAMSLVFGWSCYTRLRSGGLPRFLAICPAGLLVCAAAERRLIPWPDVIEARRTWHGTVLKYRLRWRRWRIPFSTSAPRAFDHRLEAEEFCAALRVAQQRY